MERADEVVPTAIDWIKRNGDRDDCSAGHRLRVTGFAETDFAHSQNQKEGAETSRLLGFQQPWGRLHSVVFFS